MHEVEGMVNWLRGKGRLEMGVAKDLKYDGKKVSRRKKAQRMAKRLKEEEV